MSEWKNSIVTYIDLIGIKNKATYADSRATDLMRKMHTLVDRQMSHEMKNHNHCYMWNDSILLLSYLDTSLRNVDENSILQEVDNLKKKIDGICLSYAISVKGQVFPDDAILYPPVFNGQSELQPRVIRLKASSYALGNCFRIEERLGKKLKMPWYIDARIAKNLSTKQIVKKHRVKMLPKNEARDVYVYEGCLW